MIIVLGIRTQIILQDTSSYVDYAKRIREIQELPADEKEKIYSVIDALIRDYRTKEAYAS